MQMRTTSRLAFAVAGAGLALAGAILLIHAGWAVLALAYGAIWATTIVGAALAGVGGLLILAARTAHRPPPQPAPEVAMLGAFFEGLRAGRATRARPH